VGKSRSETGIGCVLSLLIHRGWENVGKGRDIREIKVREAAGFDLLSLRSPLPSRPIE